MTVYCTETGGRWHLTPLCYRVQASRGSWHTLPFEVVWDNGLRCCPVCARKASRGVLYNVTQGSNLWKEPEQLSE